MRRDARHDVGDAMMAGNRHETDRFALFEKENQIQCKQRLPIRGPLVCAPVFTDSLAGGTWDLRGNVMKGGGSDVGHTNEGLPRSTNKNTYKKED